MLQHADARSVDIKPVAPALFHHLGVAGDDLHPGVASKWMEAKAEASSILKDKRRYFLPFGLDLAFFNPGDKQAARLELGIDESALVVMTLSHPDSIFKGDDIKIRALQSLDGELASKVTLVTVGCQFPKNVNLGRIRHKHFGWVSDPDLLRRTYRAADIYLMPSRMEAFGFMAIEAMSCGAMVLTIPGTSLENVIDAPRVGVSVEEGDYPAELSRLLNNREEMVDRGLMSLDLVKERYDSRKYVDGMIRIYKDEIERFRISDDYARLLDHLKRHRVASDDVGKPIASVPSALSHLEDVPDGRISGSIYHARKMLKCIVGSDNVHMLKCTVRKLLGGKCG